jgi:hypothetical protein
MASKLFCRFWEAMAGLGSIVSYHSIVGECGGSDVRGGWKVGGVEEVKEVKEKTKNTTLGDSCMNWK